MLQLGPVRPAAGLPLLVATGVRCTAWARAHSPATAGAVAASLTGAHALGYAAGILFAGTRGLRLPGSPFTVVAVGALAQAVLSGALSRGLRSVRAVS